MRVKNNIQKVLKKKGVSILRLSKKIGLTYTNTHNLVGREDLADTKIGTLLKVADTLGVDITELYEEERDMKKIIVDILKNLDEEVLLNQTGETLARSPEKFPETFEMLGDYFEDYTIAEIEEKLFTSSLVGADEELAIQEWVAEEEKTKIKEEL